MLFFKRKKLMEIDTKLENLITLINSQAEIIKMISTQLNNLEAKQKLLEEICNTIIKNSNSELFKLEVLENKTDKNSENIINTENIINKSKSEILNFINDSEKNIISSVKQEALSNTKINQKFKDEVCNEITASTRNITDIKDSVNKSKSEILNSINNSEKNIVSSVKQEALSNTKINEKLKDEICDKISASTRNISSEVNTLDKELKLLLLNSIMEQL